MGAQLFIKEHSKIPEKTFVLEYSSVLVVGVVKRVALFRKSDHMAFLDALL